jgi:ABC-type multidrug transport system fused ATPase/permease subunit
MVLDSGKIAEFDAPAELMKDKNGLLRALVDESADKEELYAMVEGVDMS